MYLLAEVHEKFIEHLKNHYDHQCPKCDYSSRTEGRLRRHMESFHSAVPPENFSGKSTRSSDKPKAQHCKQCDYVAETKARICLLVWLNLGVINNCRVTSRPHQLAITEHTWTRHNWPSAPWGIMGFWGVREREQKRPWQMSPPARTSDGTGIGGRFQAWNNLQKLLGS